jgi:hypothetical protein
MPLTTEIRTDRSVSPYIHAERDTNVTDFLGASEYH